MSNDPTVFVVDDDPAIRNSLKRLVSSVNLPVETFADAREFLAARSRDRGGCLVLDVRMPGMSGLDLQELLASEGASLPVIVVTGHGDIPMAVRAMRAGAVDFIEKPYRAQLLLDRIQEALAIDAKGQRRRIKQSEIAGRLALLTPREAEVQALLVCGNSVKQIAAKFGLSHKTVQVHRAHIMEKMQANSLADLVRFSMISGTERRNA